VFILGEICFFLAVVVVMIVISVPAVAPCPHVFQIAALVLCLAAMLTMFALGIMQLGFGFADLLFALSVITINRPCGNHSAQERQNHKRRNECLGFLEHASSSGLHNILISDAHASHDMAP
jgi:hypothetical protein